MDQNVEERSVAYYREKRVERAREFARAAMEALEGLKEEMRGLKVVEAASPDDVAKALNTVIDVRKALLRVQDTLTVERQDAWKKAREEIRGK